VVPRTGATMLRGAHRETSIHEHLLQEHRPHLRRWRRLLELLHDLHSESKQSS
jgi:hypothetical protein